MNYIEQIKGFWLAQEAYQLGTSEIALYFYLLETCNKTGWTGTFYRNNYKVMADLSIRSRKTLQSVRDKLKSAGIIDYYQSKGNANVQYMLLDLGKKYTGKGTGLGTSWGTGLGTSWGTLNKTKLNQTNNLSKDKLIKPGKPKDQKPKEEKGSAEKEETEGPKEPKFDKRTFRSILLEKGANKQHVIDWFKVRDKKNAAYTQTSLNRFLNECKEHNFPVSEAVKACAENDWKGFKYAWIKNNNNGSYQKNNAKTIPGRDLNFDNP